MNKWNRKTCLLKKKNDCWLRRDAAGLHESLGWIGCRPGSLTSSTSMCVSTPRWPPNGEGVTPQMDGVSTRLTIRPRLSYSVCVCSLHIASSFSPPLPLLPFFLHSPPPAPTPSLHTCQIDQLRSPLRTFFSNLCPFHLLFSIVLSNVFLVLSAKYLSDIYWLIELFYRYLHQQYSIDWFLRSLLKPKIFNCSWENAYGHWIELVFVHPLDLFRYKRNGNANDNEWNSSDSVQKPKLWSEFDGKTRRMLAKTPGTGQGHLFSFFHSKSSMSGKKYLRWERCPLTLIHSIFSEKREKKSTILNPCYNNTVRH